MIGKGLLYLNQNLSQKREIEKSAPQRLIFDRTLGGRGFDRERQNPLDSSPSADRTRLKTGIVQIRVASRHLRNVREIRTRRESFH